MVHLLKSAPGPFLNIRMIRYASWRIWTLKQYVRFVRTLMYLFSPSHTTVGCHADIIMREA